MPKGPFLPNSRTPPDAAAPAEPAFTTDTVEGHEWFQRLPPAEKEDFRRREAERERRGVEREKFARSSLRLSMAQGMLVFGVTETLGAIPSVLHTVAGLVAGAAVGALWFRLRAGRFRCMLTAIPPYVVLRVAFAIKDTRFGLAATCVYAVVGFLLLLALANVVGQVRERRTADDADY